MIETAIAVEAAGNLAMVYTMLVIVMPRVRRGQLYEIIPATFFVAVFAATNVAYAAFYAERRLGWLPSWAAYDTTFETVIKGIQIGSMYALPAGIVVAAYSLFKDHRRRP